MRKTPKPSSRHWIRAYETLRQAGEDLSLPSD